ncbi:DUF935 domain-containing protein [Endozoicomonas numazuensis]|uniref:Mu-like prophage FluMu protein gp29 n=1 Tax=Endozoicomonas numazuensis TaxID=1137799 RepID=A0A081NL55_9GAMM|nr:DUF935 domain-containing protein [Endozoicomonas numazuensis]KEQ19178.1 hypothetical protein GZ78_04065 [Endozoicomonas numazuensis]
MAKSTIQDINGNPFDLDLEGQQTDNESKLAMLRQHYSDHPSSGLTPHKLAGILKNAEDNDLIAQSELAADFEEKDGHLFSELSKRRRAVLGYDWRITPPADASDAEKDDAAMIESMLRQCTWLEDALFDMTDCILKGFSALELEWENFGGEMLPVSAEQRDSAWFQTNPHDRNELRLRDGSYEGVALRAFGWINHCARAKSGYLGRQGLVRVLAWPFIFKNYSVRDLAEFLEIYGLPIRLGKYPGGATEKEKATLLRAVMSIGHNAGGIIPQGMEIDFERASSTANADSFMKMVDWCERTQSKAILGGTLTSQADGKSSTNALGNVHNEVRKELTESDARQLARTVTRDLVYPIYVLNGRSYQNPRRIPQFQFDFTEPGDIAALSKALPGLVNAGVRIPLNWANQELQIPEPKEDEEILTSPKAQSPVLDQSQTETALKGPLNSALAILKTDAEQPQSHLDDALGSIPAESLQALMMPMLEPLIKAIETEGPEAAMEQLAELYPTMDDTELTEQLSRVLFVAQTWGRLNAQK